MSSSTPISPILTVSDVAVRFGPIPVSRLRSVVGKEIATVDDVISIHDRENRLFELVDGFLVEKAMGSYESMVAIELTLIIATFIRENELGRVLGEAGMVRLNPNLVRIPDISFISNARFEKIAFDERIWQVAPDLAVEVLSDANTVEEMDRKLRDYFEHGVQEVWYVEPHLKCIRIYESLTTFQVVTNVQIFSHSRVLVGLEFPVERLFQLSI